MNEPLEEAHSPITRRRKLRLKNTIQSGSRDLSLSLPTSKGHDVVHCGGEARLPGVPSQLHIYWPSDGSKFFTSVTVFH